MKYQRTSPMISGSLTAKNSKETTSSPGLTSKRFHKNILQAFIQLITSGPSLHSSKKISMQILLLLALGILTPCLPVFAANILFSWDPNTESDLAGYKLYKRTLPSQDFQQPIFSGLPSNPSSPTAIVSGLSEGTTYGFIATAFDTSGNESAPSIEKQITLTTSSPPPPPPGPNTTLLTEDFSSGTFTGWAIVDEGSTSGPSTWSAATGSMTQTSNIYAGSSSSSPLHQPGTYAVYEAGVNWTDYQSTLTLRSNDNDILGIMFRYQDPNNYYRFSWDAQRTSRRLTKVENGIWTLLAGDSVPYNEGQTYQVEIKAQGSALEVWIDQTSIFTVTDASLPSGTLALYSWANNGSVFDNVVVSSSATSTPPTDTTSPSVTLTAPSNGSTVSGVVTLTATAADNVGVAGIQFGLNGTNLSSEDTTSPYTTSWNSITMADGTYTLTATARDTEGNTTTSLPVSVTISNTVTPPTPPSTLTILNLTTASGLTYVVPTGGLQVGNTVYIDRSFEVKTVPVSLQGAAYIQTANNDKAATQTDFLSFDVNQPVTVSVGHDERINPKPTWLSTFTDTGKSLRTSDTTLHLFTQTFAAGTITLGGNAGSGKSMYAVIVQPQNGTAPSTDATPPTVPSTLQTTPRSTTEISLTWTPSTDNVGVTSYTIARNGTAVGSTPFPSYTDQDLSPSTLYTYTVTAEDAAGNISAPSTAASATTMSLTDTTPPEVALLSPKSNEALSGLITVSATAADNVGVAGIQFGLNGTNLSSEDTTNPYTINWDTTIVADGRYALSATARDTEGNTTTSLPVSVTISNTVTPPTPPSTLTILNLTTASGLTYVVPTGGLQVGNTVYIDRSFEVKTVPVSLQGAAYIQTANNDKAATQTDFLSFDVNQPVTVSVGHDERINPKPTWLSTFTDTGKSLRTSDTTLHLFTQTFAAGTITLGGNAGSGKSMYAVIVQPQNGTAPSTDATPPTVPSTLQTTPRSTTEISLTWTPSTDNVGVTSYTIARNGTAVGSTPFPSYTDQDLSPSTLYTYTVTAEDAAGNISAPSTAASATTMSLTDTTPPEDFAASLSWQANTESDLVGYKVHYGTSSKTYTVAENVGLTTNPNLPSHIVHNLSEGMTYYFSITAVDASGNESGFSPERHKHITQ